MNKILPAIFVLLFTSQALAEECLGVIEFSKVKGFVVQNSSVVKQHAANFCKEYSEKKSQSDSSSFGASYEFLAASYGSSGASMSEVASRYCSANSGGYASDDAYRQFVENIAPGAYSAYTECLKMSKKDIRFDIHPASILPEELSITASYSGGADTEAHMSYSSSKDVRCEWNDTDSVDRVLPNGTTAVLKCERDDHRKRSFIKIIRTNHGRTHPITLLWRTYDEMGNPVDALQEISETVGKVGNEVEQLHAELDNTENKLAATSNRVSKIENSGAVEIYQCPMGTNGYNPGGAWASYGCQGQISSQKYCQNKWSGNRKQNRECKRIGRLVAF